MNVRRIIREGLTVAAIALLLAVVAGAWHPRRPAWTPPVAGEGEVLLRTARAWGADVVWVDVRPPDQYLLNRVPGALPLPMEQWDRFVPTVLTAMRTAKKVVVYCEDDNCAIARLAAERLRRETGRDEIYVLKGGFAAWQTIMVRPGA